MPCVNQTFKFPSLFSHWQTILLSISLYLKVKQQRVPCLLSDYSSKQYKLSACNDKGLTAVGTCLIIAFSLSYTQPQGPLPTLQK